MVGLDLTGVADVVNDWLVDEVLIYRDSQYEEDTLDDTTGNLTAAPVFQIYDGTGAVQPIGSASVDPQQQRVLIASGARYRILLPTTALFATEIRPGDKVRVVTAVGASTDADVLTRLFQVVDFTPAGSWSVVTSVWVKLLRVDRASTRISDNANGTWTSVAGLTDDGDGTWTGVTL